MTQWQQQPGDRLTQDRVLRWNLAGWILFGLLPPAVAVLDASPSRRYWLLGLLALIALCHTVVLTRLDNPLLHPRAYLAVLALVLGATAYLLDGGAAFYVVSLPQFWFFTRAPRDAITLSGAAAALTVFGGTLGQGWSPQFLTGNAVFTGPRSWAAVRDVKAAGAQAVCRDAAGLFGHLDSSVFAGMG
ncbi:hypothetical protein ACGFZQ_42175 [Streptomyces sp. NPDC048254]|uniref:hypothetical protein n=1 Tax=Streptomyces sp. NPDC048254 TaxID=3365525 RepID=UPI003716A366